MGTALNQGHFPTDRLVAEAVLVVLVNGRIPLPVGLAANIAEQVIPKVSYVRASVQANRDALNRLELVAQRVLIIEHQTIAIVLALLVAHVVVRGRDDLENVRAKRMTYGGQMRHHQVVVDVVLERALAS